MKGNRISVIKKPFKFGGSIAVVVPAQLGLKAGQPVKFTFEVPETEEAPSIVKEEED
jgi:hypothetical protein